MNCVDPALAAPAGGRNIIIAGDRLRGGGIDFRVAASKVTPRRGPHSANLSRDLRQMF